MTNRKESTLHRLLSACLPADDCQVPLRTVEDCPALLRTVKVAPSVLDEAGGEVSRAVVAQALNLLLFRDLLARVSNGRRVSLADAFDRHRAFG